MKKKIVALLLLFVSATSCTSLIGAYDGDNYSSPTMNSVSPYLVSIQSNIPTLSISGTQATITVQYKLYTNCIAEVSTTLQKSSNKSTWSKVQEWLDTDSGAGTHILSHNTNISTGYYYRLKCTISTYDTSNNLIEKNTSYSSSIFCSDK